MGVGAPGNAHSTACAVLAHTPRPVGLAPSWRWDPRPPGDMRKSRQLTQSHGVSSDPFAPSTRPWDAHHEPSPGRHRTTSRKFSAASIAPPMPLLRVRPQRGTDETNHNHHLARSISAARDGRDRAGRRRRGELEHRDLTISAAKPRGSQPADRLRPSTTESESGRHQRFDPQPLVPPPRPYGPLTDLAGR